MHIDELRALNKKTPFRPFTIELDNGRRLSVPHGDCLLIPPNGQFVVRVAEPLDIDVIDQRHVSAVHIDQNGRPA